MCVTSAGVGTDKDFGPYAEYNRRSFDGTAYISHVARNSVGFLLSARGRRGESPRPFWLPHSKETLPVPERSGADPQTASLNRSLKKVEATPGTMTRAAHHAWVQCSHWL